MMKLTIEEANLFFELFWSLQIYINNNLRILAAVDTIEEFKKLSQNAEL